MENKKIIYYKNKLEDEFSTKKIVPIKIDENYNYYHNVVWNFFSFVLQNIISIPVKYFYAKLKFHIKFIGKEKFRECKESGYFIYANHTQNFADTFIPSLANYPRRSFFIVNPENISMKGLKKVVELLGAIPVPGDVRSSKNFLGIIKNYISKNRSITIYPEAHIWPYYTKIREFKSVSFKYPVQLDVPIYTITNTYQKNKNKDKINITSYIDGPFYPNKELNIKKAQEELRNIAYKTMTVRSKNSSYEHIIYKHSEGADGKKKQIV